MAEKVAARVEGLGGRPLVFPRSRDGKVGQKGGKRAGRIGYHLEGYEPRFGYIRESPSSSLFLAVAARRIFSLSFERGSTLVRRVPSTSIRRNTELSCAAGFRRANITLLTFLPRDIILVSVGAVADKLRYTKIMENWYCD